MKEIVVISGKGGTGKTTILSSLCTLAHSPMIADCDVDAANMHIMVESKQEKETLFSGGKKAIIDEGACQQCGVCIENCRFNAISDGFEVMPRACEGCSVCVQVCPHEAVSMKDSLSASIYLSSTAYGPMSHAELYPGEEGSGKLVTAVRQQARKIAEERGLDLILVDGPPGIGCPVIATVTGASMALLVCEPSVSGLSDLERVMTLCNQLNVPLAVCVNKYDINTTITSRIHDVCSEKSVPVVGNVPYHEDVREALLEGKVLVESYQSAPAVAIRDMWEKIRELFSSL